MRLFQVLLSIVPIVVTPLTPLTDANIQNALITYFDTATKQDTIAEYGDISEWNTVGVTHMNDMFANSDFNGDLSKWNTGAVLRMDGMFQGSQFNGDISKWNTGAVIGMYDMFSGSQFNGDISKWNTGAVSGMGGMFDISGFKRTLCGGNWGLALPPLSGINGRLGCCPARSFMSNPMSDPFKEDSSCSPCFTLDVPNDETSCPPPVVKKGVCTAFVIATGECTGVTCNKNHANLDNDASNGCEELSRVELKKMYSSTAC